MFRNITRTFNSMVSYFCHLFLCLLVDALPKGKCSDYDYNFVLLSHRTSHRI